MLFPTVTFPLPSQMSTEKSKALFSKCGGKAIYRSSCNSSTRNGSNPVWIGGGGPVPLRLLRSRSRGPLSQTLISRAFRNLPPTLCIQMASSSTPSQYDLPMLTIARPRRPFQPSPSGKCGSNGFSTSEVSSGCRWMLLRNETSARCCRKTERAYDNTMSAK